MTERPDLAIRMATGVRRMLDLALLVLIAGVLGTVLFARLVPAVTGASTLVIGGGSMAPAMPVGAVVLAFPVDPSALRVGDVVSLRPGPDRAIVTHRITRLVDRDGAVWLATRGDANENPDPSIVPASAAIGRVDVAVPMLGYLVTLLSTIPGILFALGLAGSLLAAGWLVEAAELDLRDRRRARLPTDRTTSLERAAILAASLGEPMPARRASGSS